MRLELDVDMYARTFTPRMLPRVAALLSLGLVACSESEKPERSTAPVELLPGFEPVATPSGGFAAYTPIIRDIPPGADVTYCTYTEQIPETDLFVHQVTGKQSAWGHHVIAFYTPVPEPPRTEECYGSDMTKLRQLLGGAGAEGAFTYVPPPNVGNRIPAGSQFVIQTHWVNTEPDPIEGQAMLVTHPGASGSDRIEAGTLAVVNIGFQIPPIVPYQSSTTCTFDQPEQLMMSLGHEHRMGTHVRAEVTHAAGGTQVIFDHAYEPSFEFSPPFEDYGVVTPFAFSAGDVLSLTCDWVNPTNQVVGFPTEMCVFVGYSLRAQDAFCTNGVWRRTGSGDAGPPDGAPVL